MSKCAKALKSILFSGALLIASRVGATTYYVDYTNGADSNNGTSKSSPWKTAPGMVTNSGVSSSTTLNPGDSVIFKGCVTWPNAVWAWLPKFEGTASAPIYYGVDKTWWDNTVGGCASAWNRPIFNAGGATFYTHGNGPQMLVATQRNFNTFDNFEFTGYYADGEGQPITSDYVAFAEGATGAVVENCYFHGWIDPYYS